MPKFGLFHQQTLSWNTVGGSSFCEWFLFDGVDGDGDKRWKDRIEARGLGSSECGYFDEEPRETVEAESFEHLDMGKTGLIIQGSPAGWLSRTGRWLPCHPERHKDVARVILGLTEYEIERQGWVKVYNAPGESDINDWFNCGRHRLSAEQRNWLSAAGHAISDQD